MRRVQIGDIVEVTLPYSEVCCHLRVEGQRHFVELQSPRKAQLYDYKSGNPISFPILPSEAGVFEDDEGFYVT